jgi:hypothetical protein
MKPAQWIFLLAMLLATAVVGADDKLPVIRPEQAREHVGKAVVLQMKVNSSRLVSGKKICFLNSEKDHAAAGNVTIFMDAGLLEKLAAAGIQEPHVHYRDKVIAVTGKIAFFKDRPQIKLDNPMSIVIVEKSP